MNKKLVLVLALSFLLLFAGCGKAPAVEEVASDVTEEFVGDCVVSFMDGDAITDLPVEAYGDEFTLPECESDPDTFYGWIGMDGLYQPGDKVISEEFMSFAALRSVPDAGTLLALDPVRGGYSTSSGEGEQVLYSPYENYEDNSCEDFFDYWEDDAGNTYEADEAITVANGDVLILTAVYSTDHSKAYKVDVHYNTGDPDFDSEYSRYVKKGASIPLWLMIEPAGCRFDGWYDAPEGGNLVANETDPFTPTSDISLYGHWIKE